MRSVSMRPSATHESGHSYFAQTGHSHFAATLAAISLCPGQEKRRMRQTEAQIGYSGFSQGRPIMKRIWLCALLLGFWPALGLSQTTEELVNDGKNAENVTTQSMGYDRKSYSPLKQINKSNVKRLVQIWSTPVELESGIQRNAFNRGAATIYNGKLFRVTIDNHVLALDMETGKVLWNQKFADFRDGYYATGGPIIANGVLISGVSGGESTTRGFLDGWDPDTGKRLWRRYTIPAPGEPGSETWPKNSDAWKYGGGPTWRSGSYDPELDLVYWGTGNAEPYDPRPREGLDSLFTNSVLALRPKTGEVVCYYQYTPNDVYDVDATDEQLLADIRVAGKPRKVMIQANKNGFMYVLDRTNCKLIAAHPYVKVNWATGIDLGTGRPVLTDVYKRFAAGEEVEIWPSRGTNAVPIAFNPNTGSIYASTWNIPRLQKIAAPKPQVLGAQSTGVDARQPEMKPGDIFGHFAAINPLTGEKKWEVPLTDLPSSAGMLVTGGGLVFTGRLTGEFIALDEDTGKTLWQFKTGSSVNSTAITYTHRGRQYVTVASGLGGILATRYAAAKVPTGGSIWTFALMQE